jgi:hypothetical protein
MEGAHKTLTHTRNDLRISLFLFYLFFLVESLKHTSRFVHVRRATGLCLKLPRAVRPCVRKDKRRFFCRQRARTSRVGGDKALFIPFLPSKKTKFSFLTFLPHSSINARGERANLKFPKFRWPLRTLPGSYFSSQKT